MYSGIYFAEFGNENRKGKQNVSDRDRVRIMRWKIGDPKFYHLAKLGWSDLVEGKKIELVIQSLQCSRFVYHDVHSTQYTVHTVHTNWVIFQWGVWNEHAIILNAPLKYCDEVREKKSTENTSKLEWSNLKKHFTVNATLLFYIVDWDPM